MSSESLRRVVGDGPLDEIMEGVGVRMNSSLFRIDVEDGDSGLEFA
jgi:hypothetical protein